MPNNHRVLISLTAGKLAFTDANGANASTLSVREDDDVDWEWAGKECHIAFETGNSPCAEHHYHGKPNVRGKVRKGTGASQGKQYKYLVAVVDNHGQAFAEDPYLIVKP